MQVKNEGVYEWTLLKEIKSFINRTDCRLFFINIKSDFIKCCIEWFNGSI